MERSNRKFSLALLIGTLALGGLIAAQGATILDWADWEGDFINGSVEKQKFTTPEGVDVEYDPKVLKEPKEPKEPKGPKGPKGGEKQDPTFLFETPAIALDPSSGNFGLFVGQNGQSGAGMEHKISIKRSVQGISFTISGVDTNAGAVEELSFKAKIAGVKDHVAPTRVIVTNSSYVSVIGGDTVRAIGGQQVLAGSTAGNVQVFFDIANIDHIDIDFINSTFGVAGDVAISISGVTETGLVSIPAPVPEPGVATLMLFAGGALLGRRRR